MTNFEGRINELEHKNSILQRNFEQVLQLNEELREENKELRKENFNLKYTIVKLEKKVFKLEKELERYKVKPNQPSGSKPNFEKNNSQKPDSKPGQKLGHKGISRITPKEIHKETHYKVDCCEHCKSTNLVDFQTRSKVITDLEIKVVNTKKHCHDMKCLICGKTTKAKSPNGNSNSPFGKTIQTLASYISSVGGMTKRPLENLFRDFLGVEISDSTLINTEIRNSKELFDEYNNYLNLVKQDKFSHKDETSYRVGGKTNWIWVYDSINYVFYRIAPTRSKQVLINDFGFNENQISINDCYASYNLFKNQQICWAHILRECEFHSEKENSSFEEQEFYKELLELYKQAQNFIAKTPPIEIRQSGRAYFENKLCDLMLSIKIKSDFLERMFERLNKNLMYCFLFVEIEGLPSTNNQAERSIRPLVCHRKVSQGSKSFDGAQAKMIFKTLFENAKRQQKQLSFALNSLFEPSNCQIWQKKT